MKTFFTSLILALTLHAATAQEADYVIEAAQGEEVVLRVSGFAYESETWRSESWNYMQNLSIDKLSGGDYVCDYSDLSSGRVKFVFKEPETYLFDFWEDNDGCRMNTTVRFEIAKETILIVPNIFTPNGDGINDQFHITYDNRPQTFDIVIYNREGKKMYSSSNPDFHWDGSHCTAGVYSYLIKYTSLGKPKTMKGYITLAD